MIEVKRHGDRKKGEKHWGIVRGCVCAYVCACVCVGSPSDHGKRPAMESGMRSGVVFRKKDSRCGCRTAPGKDPWFGNDTGD